MAKPGDTFCTPKPETVERLGRLLKEFEVRLREVVGTDYWGRVRCEAVIEGGQIREWEALEVRTKR